MFPKNLLTHLIKYKALEILRLQKNITADELDYKSV